MTVKDGSYYEENKANFLIYRNLPLTIIGVEIYGATLARSSTALE